MKNYLFYAIGAIALITGCSQEEFPDKGANTKSENFQENGITQEGTGIQGIAYVKLKPSVNEEVRKVSLHTDRIRRSYRVRACTTSLYTDPP